MAPNLIMGDIVLVDKIIYGFKIPFSHKYISNGEDIKRGDVIVFQFPQESRISFAKRVIAIGGDQVEIKNKEVYINGQKNKREHLPENFDVEYTDSKFEGLEFEFHRVISGETKHLVQYNIDNYFIADYGPRIVPDGHYFVLGDNRDFSYDSRFWGFIPSENVAGKARRILFSITLPFGEKQFKLNLQRTGLPVY